MIEIDSIFRTNGTDEIYCAIQAQIDYHCQEAKIFVEGLWREAHQYVDPKIHTKLPNQFHQRFWELYLAASLLEAGLNLQYKSVPDGPDICVEVDDGLRIWVEAVTAAPGQGNDAVQEVKLGTVRSVPDDQIKLRLLNAFAGKSKKYQQYREKNWVGLEDPYIIAINAAQVPSARLELEIPRIIMSFLPFGFPVLHLSRETLEVTGTGYEYQGKVIKASGTEIETTSFLNPEYSGISAVIYSCVDAFNHPTEISQSLLLFHNPLATAPLPLGFLKKGQEYWVVGGHLKNKNWNQG